MSAIFLYHSSEFVLNDVKFTSISYNFDLGNFSLIFTTLALIAFIQASNMIDGINCQFGVYAIVTLIFSLHFPVTFISFFLPSLIIYLIFNFKNKSFIGDGGAYLISTLLGLNFIYIYNDNLIFSDDVFLAMSIPGFEMIRLFFQEALKRKVHLVVIEIIYIIFF